MKYKIKMVLADGTKLPDQRVRCPNLVAAIARAMVGRHDDQIQYMSVVRTCGYKGKA